jgi:sterol desaturase/sphingolipid hydroxylase (fatty acid hydroxylase superfamily)
VNCGDSLIPLDRWFGTFHDGSKAGDAQMQARHAEKKARLKARATA